VQKSAGKVLASICLGSRRHAPHRLSSKGPNYQRVVLLISASVIEGHFEGKNAAEISPKGVLFLHDNAPAQRSLATLKKLAYLGFQCNVFITHPIPRRTTNCYLDWEKKKSN
jgi:hypothetical protein